MKNRDKYRKQWHVYFWILLFCEVMPCAFAQRITDVRFEQFGQAIRVHYTLSRLPYNSFVMLELYVSTNGGVSFTGPLVRVQGDVGKVDTNGPKGVIWEVMDEWGSLDGQVVFELRGDVVNKKSEVENLLMYNVSGSTYFGLMYGIVARWGGYVRGKTNFSLADAPYTCNTSGVFDYEKAGSYYAVDNVSKRSRLGITAGALYRPWPFLYLYVGAGYGFRRLIWHAQTFDYITDKPSGELWAVNTQRSVEGVEAELGAIYRYKRLGISAGINTVGFSFFEVNGAVGLFF